MKLFPPKFYYSLRGGSCEETAWDIITLFAMTWVGFIGTRTNGNTSGHCARDLFVPIWTHLETNVQGSGLHCCFYLKQSLNDPVPGLHSLSLSWHTYGNRMAVLIRWSLFSLSLYFSHQICSSYSQTTHSNTTNLATLPHLPRSSVAPSVPLLHSLPQTAPAPPSPCSRE